VFDGTPTNREAILSCITADRPRERSRDRLAPMRSGRAIVLSRIIDHQAAGTAKARLQVHPQRAILDGIEVVP